MDDPCGGQIELIIPYGTSVKTSCLPGFVSYLTESPTVIAVCPSYICLCVFMSEVISAFSREGGVSWRFFSHIDHIFMLTIYTLQMKLYFVGNIVV